ncbi:hexameric tyrosine-coordinated heme protein [Marinobacter sp. SS13-12]|uniref:hexameric tyrosine-coordinated heme protein n=1 Tax=Marinobacter sp. SS13-12 TaxID=3050451 RepID=UPI002555E0B0|nr:hexameric tyrosine-coordinated heme protein [Marinobacter sp. SS13-12]MDK8463310.1 hexameric tyrosine-coordinated heme protein [Marinobacter sp. SS13-12]
MIKPRNKIQVVCAALVFSVSLAVQAEDQEKSDIWLPSLVTETPQEGFQLAIKLSRMGVKSTQSDKETLFRERAKYSQDGEALIHASEVIAVHFQTVAAANNYWK